MIGLKTKIQFGTLLNRIPYTAIPVIGRIYKKAERDIVLFNQLSIDEKKLYVFNKVCGIVKYAIENIPFYQQYYHDQGFQLSDLKTYEDIERIPLVNKTLMLSVPIEQRSSVLKGSFVANTGGSTGHPLSFYKTKDLKVKEMAYFHYMWGTQGYKKSDIRLHFVGRSHLNGCLKYNLIENSIQADVYTPFGTILAQLRRLRCNIKYLHGYPSVLYEFALYCESHKEEFQKSGLDRTLKGAFLKSEFPHPMFREKIETVFGIKTFSHYGHTEVCALAGELHKSFRYDVLQSYGYVTIKKVNGEDHLVATTFDNFASPLIQYDTEDSVSNSTFDKGLLKDFQMKGGRNGDYIIDKYGKRLSLTGVIFGNHHKLFDYCSQIQIGQSEQGKATVYYVPKQKLPEDFNPALYFETQNVEIDFRFKQISEPIKTKIGKVLLKVEELI